MEFMCFFLSELALAPWENKISVTHFLKEYLVFFLRAKEYLVGDAKV